MQSLQRFGGVVGLAVIISSFAPKASAQRADTPSRDAIVDALKPHKLRAIRGVNIAPGQMVQAAPSINLKVNFAYKSADLTTDTQIVLKNLGQALNDEVLKGYRFRIAGHTDAVGGDDYNQRLSEARANAVRNYLIATYHITPERIYAEGHGRTQLFDPTNPTSEINRRVEIVNIGE